MGCTFRSSCSGEHPRRYGPSCVGLSLLSSRWGRTFLRWPFPPRSSWTGGRLALVVPCTRVRSALGSSFVDLAPERSLPSLQRPFGCWCWRRVLLNCLSVLRCRDGRRWHSDLGCSCVHLASECALLGLQPSCVGWCSGEGPFLNPDLLTLVGIREGSFLLWESSCVDSLAGWLSIILVHLAIVQGLGESFKGNSILLWGELD